MLKEEQIKLIHEINSKHFKAKRVNDYVPIILEKIKSARIIYNAQLMPRITLRTYLTTIVRSQFRDLMKIMP